MEVDSEEANESMLNFVSEDNVQNSYIANESSTEDVQQVDRSASSDVLEVKF